MTLLRCMIAAQAIVCLLCQFASAETLWHTDLNKAREQAQELRRPLLVHFGATWCAPCVKMERTVLNQPAVLEQLKANAVCVKIDVDQQKALVKRFGVQQFPMDIFLEPTGERLMESTGYHPPEEYIALVDRASRRYSSLVASRQPKTPGESLPTSGNTAAMPLGGAQVQPMLEGYCPVTLHGTRGWTKGDVQFQTDYKNQRFYFVSQAAKDSFVQSPEKYAPQFLGCDPVLLFTADRAVTGSVEWAAFFDQRLYLFTTEENRRNFKASPEKYIRAQVVLNIDQIETAFQ